MLTFCLVNCVALVVNRWRFESKERVVGRNSVGYFHRKQVCCLDCCLKMSIIAEFCSSTGFCWHLFQCLRNVLLYSESVLCGRAWLDKCPALLALALYSYLRVIVDHGGPIFAQLRQREVDFCVSLMRQRVNIMRVVQHGLVDITVPAVLTLN